MDVFISYAAEDRDIVQELAVTLQSYGLEIWFDQFSLSIGDSLLEKIDEGLSSCEFGVVVLSPNFFGKRWPRRELRSIETKELGSGAGILLPVWHNISAQEVRNFSLSLADRRAATLDMGVAAVARQIFNRVIREHVDFELSYAIQDVRLLTHDGLLDISGDVAPDIELLAEVSILNSGTSRWVGTNPSRDQWESEWRGPIRLGTTLPRDRASALYHPSWEYRNRPSTAPETTSPGKTTTFSFSILAPSKPGAYIEHFSLVCDGHAWMVGPLIRLDLMVT